MSDDDLSCFALKKSLQALEDGLAEYAHYPNLSIARDGVIQRFEMTIDLSKAILIRYLLVLYEVTASKKDVFREAAKAGLVADAEIWIGYVNARNKTSHNYDSEIADNIFKNIAPFIRDMHHLIQRLDDVNR